MEQASLESPLIPSHCNKSYVSSTNGGEDMRSKRAEVLAEVKKQLWLAGPLIATSLLLKTLQVISVMFVGHLGELALSGASMATSFAGVTGYSLMVGMVSALDTLCGQSYGAKQYHMLGIHMQRAMVVLMLVSIPVSIVWAYTGPLLVALGQDPEISAEAGLYSLWLIPSVFAYGLLNCLVKFLQTQSIAFPMMISAGVTTLLHFFVCWALVFKSGLGNKGAALANAISYWINVSLLALYVKFSPACKKTWTGFSREAFRGIPNFVALAIPAACMVCLEIWCFELLLLLSGLLPNPKLETSVMSICLNTASILFMIPMGLGSVISTRTSNELGAGRPKSAQLAVRVVVVMAIVEGLLLGLVMVLVRGVWGRAYTNEEEVVKYLAVMLPLIAASNFVDGIQCVLSGVARGCGWQKVGAYVNLGAYYIVGVPCAVFFAFVVGIGGKGLLIGFICALIVQMLLLLAITLCSNWEKVATMARERVYSSSIPVDMVKS